MKINPKWTYLLLMPFSMMIPLMHLLLIDDILEQQRLPWGLMPSHLLIFRWCGEIAWVGPFVLLGLFALSWKFKALAGRTAIAGTSMLYYILTVFYASYACLLISVTLRQ